MKFASSFSTLKNKLSEYWDMSNRLLRFRFCQLLPPQSVSISGSEVMIAMVASKLGAISCRNDCSKLASIDKWNIIFRPLIMTPGLLDWIVCILLDYLIRICVMHVWLSLSHASKWATFKLWQVAVSLMKEAAQSLQWQWLRPGIKMNRDAGDEEPALLSV